MIQVSLEDGNSLSRTRVNDFMLLDPDSHPFAQNKARELWSKIAKTDPPSSVAEAMGRIVEFEEGIPDRIEVVEDGRYLKIHNCEVVVDKVENKEYDSHIDDNDIPF